MRALRSIVIASGWWLAGCAGLGASTQDQGPEITGPVPGQTAPAATNPDPWPRQIQLADAQVSVYQPQVESWNDAQLAFRCAVASTPTGSSQPTFGVIWGTARTQVDREQRVVSLEELRLTRSNFPTLPDRGASFVSQLQAQLPAAFQTISLDRLLASLAASGALRPGGLVVRDAPPVIFVSYAPAILVPIDGAPVWRGIPETSFERVLNTRAAILRQAGSFVLFMHVYDGWLTSGSINGPWTLATVEPQGIGIVAADLARKGQLDLLDGGNAQPKPTLANGAPAIYVSRGPAELIVFKGQPNLQPIGTTNLLWATNTTADVIVDTNDNAYFVLLAGRWYTAPALNGPWSYVSSKRLPADFRRIPPGSPAGLVLAAVAGTPQAQEALIENSIPQTASVPLVNGPSYRAVYDGPPQLAAIPGTSLQYVINSASPTIRVDAHTWYALRAGVWFVGGSLNGPWTIATLVPAAIYAIPPSSAIHYVTYVEIYGSTANVIYVGYTPGYLGTVVAPDGVVVYGTGYVYPPWIGSVYYAPPPTWCVMAQPIYSPAVGWSYGFALGLTSAAMLDGWGAPVYYTSYYHGQACCGSVSANVYGHWGNTVTTGTRSWSSNASGSGSYANDHYAGADGNVYKNDGGGWQHASGGSAFGASGGDAWANQELQARNQGDRRMNSLQGGAWGGRSADGFGGGGWGNHYGGGGFGDRFGEGGFGGGGFAGGGLGGGGFGGGRR